MVGKTVADSRVGVFLHRMFGYLPSHKRSTAVRKTTWSIALALTIGVICGLAMSVMIAWFLSATSYDPILDKPLVYQAESSTRSPATSGVGDLYGKFPGYYEVVKVKLP
jgi:hypothetical protein